ncbi:unnamed protein product [Clonostachys rosea f. rosea IK726]|uniref:Uncharacterized protein n=1 Tax=Clonostachys rosea f. rosea IK726 TaxID=1349383 RepID=A0ACA9TBR9_BIOOC|nr:unnamed protein product [Clonostachys rosea f. rosea IK726]
MHASTRRLLALSALLPAIAGLPYRALQPRAALPDKPKYSVVPLIPDENDNHNGGGNGSPGDNPSNGVVTVSLIVTKTGDTVTQTAEPTTVTQVVPTTIISVIDLDDDVTTTVGCGTQRSTDHFSAFHFFGGSLIAKSAKSPTQQLSADCHCVLPPSGNSHLISSHHTGDDEHRTFIGLDQ